MKLLWSCGAVWSARRPVKAEVAGSNPVRTAKLTCFTAVCGRVAQLAERPPEKRKVPGSMPGPTTIVYKICNIMTVTFLNKMIT